MTQKEERKGTKAGIREGIQAGKYRYNGRQRKEERQARKDTKAGKERHKGGLGKVQRQARKGTNGGKGRTQSDKVRDKGRE
jgi:hypothetical protein